MCDDLRAVPESDELVVVHEYLSGNVRHVHRGVLFTPDYGGLCLGCLSPDEAAGGE